VNYPLARGMAMEDSTHNSNELKVKQRDKQFTNTGRKVEWEKLCKLKLKLIEFGTFQFIGKWDLL